MTMASSSTSNTHLDEWLMKGDHVNIDGVCKELGELVQLVRQSHRPPDLFFVFCMKLFDRVFGENTTLCDCPVGWVRSYNGGGWLRKLSPSSSSSSSSSYTSSSSLSGSTPSTPAHALLSKDYYTSFSSPSGLGGGLSSSINGPSTSSVRSSSSSYSSADALNKLIATLAFNGDLLTVLRRSSKDFEARLSMLPVKVRAPPLSQATARLAHSLFCPPSPLPPPPPMTAHLCLLKSPVYACVESENQMMYLRQLKHPLHVQLHQLRSGPTAAAANTAAANAHSEDVTIILDAFEYFLACLLRYPTAGAGRTDDDDPYRRNRGGGQTAVLLAPPRPATSAVGEPKDWLRASAYLTLLKRFMDDLLDPAAMPTNTPGGGAGAAGRSPAGATPGPGGSASPGGALAVNADIKRPSPEARLFLTLAAEYWMDTAKVVRHHGEYLRHLASSQHKGPAPGAAIRRAGAPGVGTRTPHGPPTETILLESFGKGSALWTPATLQATFLLVQKLLSDPSLARQYDAVGALNVAHGAGLPPASATSGGDRRRGAGGGSPYAAGPEDALGSACPPCLEVLQQPLFDMLRCIFNHGGESTSLVTYSLAVELWLLYLQPWKQQRSDKDFSPKWRTYVAGNLHFYTTLLACFLRTAARVDLLPSSDPREPTHFQNLERVLDVFSTTPGLISCLDNLLDEFVSRWYPAHSRAERAFDVPAALEHTTAAEMTLARAQHVILYPDGAIDRLEFYGATIVQEQAGSRADCELLAETLQKIRLRFDRPKRAGPFVRFERRVSGLRCGGTFAPVARLADAAVAWVQGLLDLAEARSEKEERQRLDFIARLDAHARRVCTLAGLTAVPVLSTEANDGDDDDAPAAAAAPSAAALGDRNEMDGRLTARGRERLLRGEIKCRRDEVRVLRDALDLPLCSYEVPAVARALVTWSKQLNARYRLPRDPRAALWTFEQIMREALRADLAAMPAAVGRCLRFNLRCLASARAIAVAAVLFVTFLWLMSLMGTFVMLLSYVVGCAVLYHG